MNKKKIIIFGLPGSGKSYFAKRLHQITNIELIHLDNLLVDKNTKRINIKHLGHERESSAIQLPR